MALSNLAAILYSAVFIALAGLSAWDVTIIITDYVNDNRLTMVKIKNINHTYPFVTHTEFCLFYYPTLSAAVGAVYGWNDTAAFIDESVRRGFDLLRNFAPMNATEAELISSPYYFGLFYLHSAYELDSSGDTFRDRLETLYSYYTDQKCNNSSIISDRLDRVNAFLRHPNSLEYAKSVWQDIRPLFVNPVGKYYAKQEEVLLSRLDYGEICFYIPQWTTEIIGPNYEAGYVVDIMPLHHHPIDPKNIIYSNVLRVYISNKLVLKISDASSGPGFATISIEIANAGVFDSSDFPPCTEEFNDEASCLKDIRVKTLIEVCGCLPFSYALKRALVREKIENMSLCTSENYTTCWEKATEEAYRKTEAAKADGKCAPCIFFKNTFQIQKKINNAPAAVMSIPLLGPRYLICFQISDNSYVLFKERQQIGLTQLISQVGGDLGLYIGFSVIGFLELFILLYNGLRRRRKTALQRPQKNRSCHELCHSWMEYIGKKFHHADDERQTKSIHLETKEWVTDSLNAMKQDSLHRHTEMMRATQDCARAINDLKAQVASLKKSVGKRCSGK